MKRKQIILILFGTLLIIGTAALAQNAPVSTLVPARNALGIAPTADISVTFTVDMNGSTITGSTFLVYGRSKGKAPGTVSYNPATRTATFDNTGQFMRGDVVTVTLTNGILTAAGGSFCDNGFIWSFTVSSIAQQSIARLGAYTVGASPRGIYGADIGGDGRIDIAVGHSGGLTLSLLTNNNNIGFASYAQISANAQPIGVTASDFDLDGDMDMAACNYAANTVSAIRNNGGGSFTLISPAFPTGGSGAIDVTYGDYVGDGLPEPATANVNSDDFSSLLNDYINLWFYPYHYSPTGDAPKAVISADLNNDGCLDVVTANSGSNNVSVHFNFGYGYWIFSNPPLNYAVGTTPVSVCAADLDGDGDLDLTTANQYSNNMSVLFNDGTGAFGTAVNYADDNLPSSIGAADMDGDNDIDLVTIDGSANTLSVFYNNGSGVFSPRVNWQLGSGPQRLFLADYDGDDAVDVAATISGSKEYSVWVMLQYICGDANNDNSVNTGDAVYIINYVFKGGPPPIPYAAGDCNGDGTVDVGDASCIIAYVYQGGLPPVCSDVPNPQKVLLPDGAASITARYQDGETIIELDAAQEFYGLQIELAATGGESVTSLVQNIPSFVGNGDGVTRLGLIDIEGQNHLPSGTTRLFEIAGKVDIIEAIGSDRNGNSFAITVSRTDTPALPAAFRLSQNSPNPFNPTTAIGFALPSPADVTLEIYDLLGRKINSIDFGTMEAGEHEVTFDGGDLGSGVYLYRLKAGSFSETRKMMLLK